MNILSEAYKIGRTAFAEADRIVAPANNTPFMNLMRANRDKVNINEAMDVFSCGANDENMRQADEKLVASGAFTEREVLACPSVKIRKENEKKYDYVKCFIEEDNEDLYWVSYPDGTVVCGSISKDTEEQWTVNSSEESLRRMDGVIELFEVL